MVLECIYSGFLLFFLLSLIFKTKKFCFEFFSIKCEVMQNDVFDISVSFRSKSCLDCLKHKALVSKTEVILILVLYVQ